MLIKAVVRPINTQRFGLRMHLMNGKNFEIERSLVDLLRNDDIVMELVDMLSLFVFQVAKKDDSL
jgi:hypothetical protein